MGNEAHVIMNKVRPLLIAKLAYNSNNYCLYLFIWVYHTWIYSPWR